MNKKDEINELCGRDLCQAIISGPCGDVAHASRKVLTIADYMQFRQAVRQACGPLALTKWNGFVRGVGQ